MSMPDKLLTREEIDTWLRTTFGSPRFSFTVSLARTALALMDERDTITRHNSELVAAAGKPEGTGGGTGGREMSKTLEELDAEADAILAKSDEEIMADVIIEYGNEKGASAAADATRKALLLVVRDYQISRLKARAEAAEKLNRDLLPASIWGIALATTPKNIDSFITIGDFTVSLSVKERETAKAAVAELTKEGEHD